MTTHLPLEPKLRISGAILLLPSTAFMTWAGTTLPLYHKLEQQSSLRWKSQIFKGGLFAIFSASAHVQLKVYLFLLTANISFAGDRYKKERNCGQTSKHYTVRVCRICSLHHILRLHGATAQSGTEPHVARVYEFCCRHLSELLALGIGQPQSLYRHRTSKHRK